MGATEKLSRADAVDSGPRRRRWRRRRGAAPPAPRTAVPVWRPGARGVDPIVCAARRPGRRRHPHPGRDGM